MGIPARGMSVVAGVRGRCFAIFVATEKTSASVLRMGLCGRVVCVVQYGRRRSMRARTESFKFLGAW